SSPAWSRPESQHLASDSSPLQSRAGHSSLRQQPPIEAETCSAASGFPPARSHGRLQSKSEVSFRSLRLDLSSPRPPLHSWHRGIHSFNHTVPCSSQLFFDSNKYPSLVSGRQPLMLARFIHASAKYSFPCSYSSTAPIREM